MPSLTVENYCKAVYQLNSAGETGWVTTGRLAEALRVSPGTVTSMLKALAESGLVEYRPYEGVRLTRSGQSLALRMLRRHRLLELFLVRTLDLSWDEVHEEAEHMEHAVSDTLVDRIDEYLGKPEYDPHGDPIPRSDGTLRGAADDAVPLTECPEGARVRIIRVLRQSGRFLRGLSDSGIGIGMDARIEQNNTATGVVTLRIDGRAVSVGHTVAAELLVQRADKDDGHG